VEPSSRTVHFRFGVFELDPRAGELRKSGHRIHLQEQPLRVLQALVEHPGAVVTREELRQLLWPDGTRVDFERSLTKALVKLRNALGDDADSPRFIETLPRHGYRFIAPVTTDDPHPEPPLPLQTAPLETSRPWSRRWLVGITAALVLAVLGVAGLVRASRSAGSVAHGIQSLAVLPLKNLSGDPRQDYFAEGLTEELTTDLAQIHALRVVSSTSAAHFVGTPRLADIAAQLRVDAIVEGSYVRSGDRIRVTAQLIDVRKDAHLWARSYERRMDDVLAVQASIALDVAAQINASLTREELAALSTRRPVSPDAYEAYVRGRNELGKQTQDAIRAGARHFEHAIELEPLFAAAYTGLADSYGLMANYAVQPARDAFARSKAAARRALELDGSSGDAHAALAFAMHHDDWDWAGAEVEFHRAIALAPGSAPARLRYAEFLSNLGRHDEAVEQMKVAQELDPLSVVVAVNVGRFLFYARRYDEAIRELQRALAIAPDRFYARIHLGMAYEQEGRFAEAIQAFDDASALRHGDQGVGTAHAYATAGRIQEAQSLLHQLESASAGAPVQDWFFFAGVHAALKENDLAFDWLDRAVENHDFFITYLRASPYMDPLRADPRFAARLARVGLSR
jgi:TolB-like protein/DNA-binding winged helix-turn-helix (wHTH) protein/Tfp pilus assembly protein PilF